MGKNNWTAGKEVVKGQVQGVERPIKRWGWEWSSGSPAGGVGSSPGPETKISTSLAVCETEGEVGNAAGETDQGLRGVGGLQREGGAVCREVPSKHGPGTALQGNGSLHSEWSE